MKNQMEMFKIIADEGAMGAMVFDDLSGRCLYINRVAKESLEVESSFGLSEPQTPQLPGDSFRISELYPSTFRANSQGRGFCADFLLHEGMSQNVILRKKNGSSFAANIWIRHMKRASHSPVTLVMFEDISLQKKLQRDLQAKQDEIHRAYSDLLEQNKQLKDLDRAKDRFIALTTHELRTPLAAIIATTDALVLGLEESAQQRSEFIQTVHEQALHLMELVNDTLDFAKIKAGKMDYYIEALSGKQFIDLLRKLISSFEKVAAQSGVKIEIENEMEMTDPTLNPVTDPSFIFVDQLRMREVISNIVQNAIKYNKPGGMVRIGTSRRRDHLRVTVKDTGVGIHESQFEKIFDEFETLGALARHHKGTGLGLPISRNLMRAMGGDLTLQSREGEGSEFFIDIPTKKILNEKMYRSRSDGSDDFAS